MPSGLPYAGFDRVEPPQLPGTLNEIQGIMSTNASLEELRVELAKLRLAYEVLEKSHRRLIGKVLTDKSEADHFAGQMVIDRTLLTPTWLKGR